MCIFSISNSPEGCSTGCKADDQPLLFVGKDAVGLVSDIAFFVPDGSLGDRRPNWRRRLLNIKRSPQVFTVCTCFQLRGHCFGDMRAIDSRFIPLLYHSRRRSWSEDIRNFHYFCSGHLCLTLAPSDRCASERSSGRPSATILSPTIMANRTIHFCVTQ